MDRMIKMNRHKAVFVLVLCGMLCFSTVVRAYDEKTAKIKGGRTNIRTDANTNASIVTSQSGGFELRVVDEKKDSQGNVWYKVTFSLNGASKTGFIMSDFVTITGNAAPAQTPASSGAASSAAPASVSITDIQAEVDGAVYNIAAEVPKDRVPEGFVEFNAKYDGKDITVVKNKETGVVLAYLKGEGKEGLFVYDQNNQAFKAFDPDNPTSATVSSGSATTVKPSSSAATNTKARDTEVEELKFQRFLMMVAITAEAVIILVLIIAIALKGRRDRDDYDDFDAFDEDDEDYEDDNEYEKKAPARTKADPEIDKAVQNIVAREEAERAKTIAQQPKPAPAPAPKPAPAPAPAPKSAPAPAPKPTPAPAPTPAPTPAPSSRPSRFYDNDYRNAEIEPDDDYRPANVPPRGTDAGKKAPVEFEEIDFD